MFVYVSKRNRTAEVARIIRQVRCEKCGCDYAYEMIRRGAAFAESPYHFGSSHSERTATVGIKRALEQRLAKDQDPVACPNCGWIQQSMVADFRGRSLRWMIMAAWGAFAFCIFAVGFGFLGATNGCSRPMNADGTVVVIAAAIAAIGVMPAILCIRRLCVLLINPNRGYPDKPVPVRGAPRAFKPGVPDTEPWHHEFPATIDDPTLVPATPPGSGELTYERKLPELEPGGWVTIQLSKFFCPSQCCVCLTPTELVLSYPITQLAKLTLPICATCHRRYKDSSRLLSVVVVLVCAAAGFLLSLPSAAGFQPGPAIALSVFGAMIGWWVARATPQLSRPVRFSRFRPELNTVRVRFRNPTFRRFVIEHGRLA